MSTRKAEEAGPLTRAVAAELRAEMAAQRLSTKVLAARSGVGERSLARYLNAERTFGLETLDKMAEALDVATADLIAEAQRRRHRQVIDDANQTGRRMAQEARRRANEPDDSGEEEERPNIGPAKRSK